jgi:hypothetical protein
MNSTLLCSGCYRRRTRTHTRPWPCTCAALALTLTLSLGLGLGLAAHRCSRMPSMGLRRALSRYVWTAMPTRSALRQFSWACPAARVYAAKPMQSNAIQCPAAVCAEGPPSAAAAIPGIGIRAVCPSPARHGNEHEHGHGNEHGHRHGHGGPRAADTDPASRYGAHGVPRPAPPRPVSMPACLLLV